jgi:GT2 family glycosyltransferase
MSFSIIIPSKSASNLVPCIRAIREAGETARIIVVDDGLAWDTYTREDQLAIESVDDEDIIDGVKPFVFARNVNLGIRAAGDDDVILLNDDALLKTPLGFTQLHECFDSPTPWGIMAAACDTVGNPNQFRRAGKERREDDRMVCFVCVYVPRSTINVVGLLDERFVGYGLDDDDYSLRVRNAGLKLGIFDGCYVDHGSLKSSFRGGAQSGGDFTGNMRLFIEKWGFDNWQRDKAHSEFAHLFPK